MKNLVKSGTLVLMLAVPALVFGFLKLFGQNKYELPIITPEFYDSTAVGNLYRIDSLPAFALTDQNGQPFGREDLRGKVVAVNFVFSRCRGICPQMTTQMTRVQRAFRDRDDLLIVSHSVDPEYDTPDVLREYAAAFEAQPGKWYFLTGDKKDVYWLARYGYNLPAGEDGGDEEFLHSDRMILLDRRGRIRGYYSGTNTEEVDRLIVEADLLLDENRLAVR